MSQDTYAWASTRLLPSVVFILTPVVAIGLLIAWSLRVQTLRRRYLAELSLQESNFSSPLIDLSEKPTIHDVWIQSDWWGTEQQGTSKGKGLRPRNRIVGSLQWERIAPVSLASTTPQHDNVHLGVFIRMPSLSQDVCDDTLRATLSDMNLQLGTVVLPAPKDISA